ncbi:MAG: hypothetical protein ACPH2K_05615 [Flavicella sp.]
MKKLVVVFSLLVTFQQTVSQNIDKCNEIVSLTKEGINKKSPKGLLPFLSEDFTIAGQKGNIAKLVVKQLFLQLGDTVLSIDSKRQNKQEETLELIYDFHYEKKGHREAIFLFNNQNQLKSLKLFNMEVKSMSAQSDLTKSSQAVIQVPFEMVEKLIVVEVALEGVKRKFILDTGSPKVILNGKYFPTDSKGSFISNVKGVNDQNINVHTKKVSELDFYGISTKDTELMVMDLSHLKVDLGFEFYGLIGYEIIRDYDLIFDYEKKLLTLIAPDYYETYKNTHLSKAVLEVVPMQQIGHIPVVETKVGDNLLKLGIDCGAEVDLFDVSLYDQVQQQLSNLGTEELKGAQKNVEIVTQGVINNLSIGQKQFSSIPTLFKDITHLNSSLDAKIDGLLGYPILSKQRTLISFRRNELVFIN